MEEDVMTRCSGQGTSYVIVRDDMAERGSVADE